MASTLPEIGQIYRYTHDHQTYIVFVVGHEYNEWCAAPLSGCGGQ